MSKGLGLADCNGVTKCPEVDTRDDIAHLVELREGPGPGDSRTRPQPEKKEERES